MSLEISFTVPGDPRGKGRPRFTRQGRAYTDAKTRVYETCIGMVAEAAMAGRDPIGGKCNVILKAYARIPVSWTKARQWAAISGELIPGKPDLDNIAKAALDAMNGLVYVDDVQVVRLVVEKAYSQIPRLEVRVVEVLP